MAWLDELVDLDGVLGRRYRGRCGRCGAAREFVFALPARPTPPRPGEQVTFGPLDEPSRLFDAGQWLQIADMCAQAAATPGAPDDEILESLTVAIAAIDEVLKFLPPEADAVPLTAFWTQQGRAVVTQDEGRFRRGHLRAVRAAYRDAADAR